MATTENLLNGNGSLTDFAFTFPYIKASDIKVSVGGVAKTVTTHYTLHNATTIRFTSGNIPPSGTGNVRIYRETDDSSLEATFYPGSAIKAGDLNDNFTQNLYVVQEGNNKIDSAWQTGDETIDSTETWYTTDDNRVATTKAIENRINSQIDAALVNDVVAGTDIAIADDTPSSGKITINHSVGGANTTVDNGNGVVLQDIAITAQGHVTSVGSINLDGRYYTETELNAGQLDNRYYTETETGSLIDSKIDTALSSDVLAGQSITKSASGGQVTISIADGAITGDQIGVDAVGASELADNAVASANIIDGSIVNADINASANIAGSKLADDSVTLAKLGSGALPTDITIASANIVNGTIVDADIATGTLDNRYYTETELTGGALDGRYYTETELTNGALDGRYFTETESDARYFNVSTGDTIKDGDTFPDNDTTIATTAAINDRIIDLVDDVGGFVPIANETSFPNANPDVNNGAGTLVSIKALSSNLTSNGSGVATISNGTVGNSTVTITGLANSTTYAATFGMIVETTSTLNTYTFHRQVPKATEVTTVAGSITNVNNVGNNISNVNTVAGNNSNISTVAGISSNVTTVAGISSNVTTVAGISSDVTAVAADATDIGAVAAKATEIGRLGTADAVSDLNTLGTTAIVSDLDTCATNVSNINTAAGSISNINTVATNISDVNDFSDKYRVASSAPTSNNDAGDLYFDTSSNELRVYNGSSWQGGVTATGNLAGLGANTFTGNQSLGDSKKVIFGTGGDLEIYHDGSNSTINNSTGYLAINSDTVTIRSVAQENGIVYTTNGAVDLYYDGTKKFETTSGGASVIGNLGINETSPSFTDFGSNTGGLELDNVGSSNTAIKVSHDTTNLYFAADATRGYIGTVSNDDVRFVTNGTLALTLDSSQNATFTGDVDLADSKKIKLGDSDDLQLYHNSNNYIDSNTTLFIRGDGTNSIYIRPKSDEHSAIFRPNGNVELYYDNSKKFETTSTGISTTGNCIITGHFYGPDNSELRLGSTDDLKLYHDGSNSYINDSGTGDLIIESSHIVLKDSGTQVLETTNTGVRLDDNIKLVLGSSSDLEIYHDGSNSYLTNSTGALFIKNTSGSDLDVFSNGSARLRVNAGEMAVDCSHNSSVDLYYDNVKRLETTADGVTVQKGLTVKGIEGGSAQIRIEADEADDNSDRFRLVATDGSGFSIESYDGSQYDKCFKAVLNQGVELYHNNSKKLETTSGGVNVTGALTVNGAAVGGGVWERISSYDVSGSPNGINFSWGTSSSILTDYEKLRVELYNLKTSATSTVYFRFINSSTSAISGNNYQWVGITAKHGNNDWGRYGNGWTADTKINLMQEGGRHISGHIDIADPFDNTTSDGPILMQWSVVSSNKSVYDTSDGNLWSHTGHGLFGEDVAWDTKIYGVQLYISNSSNTFTDGRMVLYGLKSS